MITISSAAQSMTSSAIREILKITQRPEVISFAGGLPAPELFPVEEIRAATDRVLTDQPAAALQYSTTEGHLPLRSWIAERSSSADASGSMSCGGDNVVDTIVEMFWYTGVIGRGVAFSSSRSIASYIG